MSNKPSQPEEVKPPSPAIASCMVSVMRDITAIGKESRNQSQNFNFRGIDAVYNERHTLLAKHGVVCLPEAGSPTTEERTNKNGTVLRFVSLPMTYRFVAYDGSMMTCSVIGEGMDSGDKATNKAMAIAHKYALLQTFLIPTEEQKDPDHDSYEVKPRQPLAAAPAPKKEPKMDFLAEVGKLQDRDKVTDDDIMAFLRSKGAKVPENPYIPDLSNAFLKRIVEKWEDVVEFSYSNCAAATGGVA